MMSQEEPKALIMAVGTFVENVPTGWVFDCEHRKGIAALALFSAGKPTLYAGWTVEELRAYKDRLEASMTTEHCCICDDETGRAGKGEDSMYCDECEKGPFCWQCDDEHRKQGICGDADGEED